MKILLIEPAKSARTFGGEDVSLFEPLALEYLGAAVAQDHDVRLLDLRLGHDLADTLQAFRPDVVGITAYTVHVNTVRRLFDEIKRWNPETLTVVGGHHATVRPADFESPSIDVVVMGEGVGPFREIVTRRERGQALFGIPGTALPGPDGLVYSVAPPLLDLDSLPLPDRSLTAACRKRYYSDWMRPLASMRTSKGCPFRCNFCALWKLAEGRYLKRHPEAIVEELAGIEEEFVFFADDESLVDARRMKDLARRIREAGLKKRFFLYGRSDTIARNPDLLEAWRDVGLERVFVGLEFATDEDLRYIRKSSTANDNDAAVRVLQGLGIEIYASFIVRPEFERRDFAALRAYCRRLGLSYASFAVLTPLPGTDLYRDVEERLLTHDYDYFDFIHTLLPTTLPLQDFYAEYCDLYRKAVSPAKQLAFLARHRWRDIPPLLAKSGRLFTRLRALHQDYEATAAAP
jgi:radical SAM superfamily enzyme YgiQ (UPF0313 family)